MWPGGKDGAGVAQRLINEIPPHDVFVSAFLGDCAVLRRIRPAARAIGIDLDRANVVRWAAEVAGSGAGTRLELYCCDAVEWLRHQFGWYRLNGTRPPVPATVPGHESRRHGVTGCLPAESQADNQVSHVPTWFVYADPPYLMSARKSAKRLYAHEMSEADHRRLLDTLRGLPCLVMVSHYPCPLYDQGLADWRAFTFQVVTRGGGRATEKVWCNYPVPDRLHDSRYLGRDKREREKIHRRVRNALGKLRRLPALERQAVLDAIAGA